jgi:hypothetical protein
MKSGAILAFALVFPINAALAAGPVAPASDLPLLNGANLNKLAANGIAANGIIANGIIANGANPGDATPLVRVRAVTLADGTVLTVTPSR